MGSSVIVESMALWAAEPEKAMASPIVKARSDGSQAEVEAGPFSWKLDLPLALGGDNKAPSPTAMLLGALSGCAVLLIQNTLAPQMGILVHSVEAEVRCKADSRGLAGMPGARPDLTEMELVIRIQSPEGEDAIQRLYETWLERCPVYLSLMKPLSVAASLVRI